MNQPLPRRMYLISYDTDKGRLETSSVLVRGSLMRAAAAADLTIGGLLRDRDGKAEASVRDQLGAAGVPIEDAVLATFAADGDVRIVFGGRERSANKAAFRALGDHVDAVLPGLRKALMLSIAARRSAATS